MPVEIKCRRCGTDVVWETGDGPHYCGQCQCDLRNEARRNSGEVEPGSVEDCSVIREGFKAEVLKMDAEELRRRIINQASHIIAYQKCADGFGFLTGLDGHRRPEDIRTIVQGLAEKQ